MSSCGTCTWYRTELGRTWGACHRYAPAAAGWPVVAGWDECGEYKPAATRLAQGVWPEPHDAGLVPGHNPATCRVCQQDGARPCAPED